MRIILILLLICSGCTEQQLSNYTATCNDSISIRLTQRDISDEYFGRFFMIDINIKNNSKKGVYIEHYYPRMNLITYPHRKPHFKIQLGSGIHARAIQPVEFYYSDNLIFLYNIDSLLFIKMQDSLLHEISKIENKSIKETLKSELDNIVLDILVLKPLSECHISIPFSDFEKGKQYQIYYVLGNSYFCDKEKLSFYKNYVRLPKTILGFEKLNGSIVSDTLLIKADWDGYNPY